MVANGIRYKGFEEFLPLYRSSHRWSDRIKPVELPLFPGYVFCRLDPRHRLAVLTIPGVLDFVGIGRAPMPIEDAEIAAIQQLVHSPVPAEPWEYLDRGQLVRVEAGPLAGFEGILIESRNQCRVAVSVTILKRSVAVEIERDWIKPLGASGLPLKPRYLVQ